MRRVTYMIACIAMLGLVACGGDDESFQASCSLSRSAQGPYAADQPLGKRLGEEEARVQLARTGFDEWIEIRSSGTWDAAWDLATPILGPGIHDDLSWLDVDGELTDLYATGDRFEFTDMRVSRSFQGKIEHDDAPIFIGVTSDQTVNFDGGCTVTTVMVGDEGNETLLDVLTVAEPA